MRLAEAVIGAAMLVLSCSGSTQTAPDAGSAPIAEADFPAAYTQAYCAVLRNCCGPAGLAFDAQACTRERPPASRAPYQTVFDSSQAARCVSILEAIASTCLESEAQYQALTDCEQRTYSGQQAIGAPCGYDDRDCVGGHDGTAACVYSGASPKTSAGVCMAVPFASAGEPCLGATMPPARCAAGLICTGVCVTRGQAGEPCLVNGVYLGGFCADGLDCIGGVCTALKPNGDPCTSELECESLRCYGGACVVSAPLPLTTFFCAGPSAADASAER